MSVFGQTIDNTAANPVPVSAVGAFAAANMPGTCAFLLRHTVANGSATQLAADQSCTMGAWVQALSTNTASVYVAGSDVSATKGWELTPAAIEFFPVANLNQLYSFASVANQKLNVRYV